MSAKSMSQPTSTTTPATANQLILTPKQAAALLNLSTSWLAKARLKGGGPPYIKMGGAVRYSAAVLQEWMRGKQRLSTSGS
jgi:predicted DNA-binding transcriptional regulator AlpA